MDLIVAVSRRWGIGNGKDLLFHLKEDLRFFRRMTLDKTVILGRRTLDSFPGGRPLPRRRHLVLSRDPAFAREGTEVFSSPEAVLEAVRDLPPDEVFVIGGGEIYRRFLPYCRRDGSCSAARRCWRSCRRPAEGRRPPANRSPRRRCVCRPRA